MKKININKFNIDKKEFLRRGGSLFLSILMLFQIFASHINAKSTGEETMRSSNTIVDRIAGTDRDITIPLPILEGLDVQFQPTKLEKEGEYPKKIIWEVRVDSKHLAYSSILHNFTTTPDSGLGKPKITKVERVTDNGKEQLQIPSLKENSFDTTAVVNNIHTKSIVNSVSLKQSEMKANSDYLITVETPITRLRDNYLLDYHLTAQENGGAIKEGHLRTAAPIYNVVNRGELIATKVVYLDKDHNTVDVYDPSALSEEEREKIAIVRNISGVYEDNRKIKWTISDTNIRSDKANQISKIKPRTSNQFSNHYNMYKMSANKDIINENNFYKKDNEQVGTELENGYPSVYKFDLPYGHIAVYEKITDISEQNEEIDKKFWDEFNPNIKAGLKPLKKKVTINKTWKDTQPQNTNFIISGDGGSQEVVYFAPNEKTKISNNAFYILNATEIKNPNKDTNGYIYPIAQKTITVNEIVPAGYEIIESSSDQNSGTYNFTNAKIKTDGEDGSCTNDGIIKVNPIEVNQIFRNDNDGYWYNWAADISGVIRAKQGLKEGDYYTLELPKDLSLNKAVSATELFFKANDHGTGKALFNIYYPELGKLRFVATKDLEIAVTSGSLDIDWRVGSTAGMPARGGKINNINVPAGTKYPWGFVIDKNYIYDYEHWPLWNKGQGLNGKLTKTMDFASTSSTEPNCIKPLTTNSTIHFEDSFDDSANRFLEKRVVEEKRENGKTSLLFEITSTLGNYKANNTDILPDFWINERLSSGGGELPLWNANSLQDAINNGSIKAYYSKKANQIGGYKPNSLVEIPVTKSNISGNQPYVLASGYNSEAGDIHFIAKKLPKGSMLVLKIKTWFKKSIPNSSYAENTINHEIINAAPFQNQRLTYRYNPTSGSGSSLAPLTFSFNIVKTDNKGNPITTSSAEFLLKKKDGTPIYKKQTDKQGKILFDGLRAGSYILSEVRAPEGYIIGEKKEYAVEVAENGNVTIDGTPVGLSYSISNPDDKSSFEIQKQDEKGAPLSGAEFTLTKPDGTEIKSAEYPVGSGKFVFDNLEKSMKYILKETKAPEGYQRITTNWEVNVLDNGDVKITGENGIFDGNKIIIKNKRQLKFTVKKVDDGKPAKPLKGVEFTLYRVPAYIGEPIKMLTNENGIAEFTGLSPGKYILSETKGIDGYIVSNKTWKVVISDAGIVTTDRGTERSIVEEDVENNIRTSFRSVADVVNNRNAMLRSAADVVDNRNIMFRSVDTTRAIVDDNFTIDKTTRRVGNTDYYDVSLNITKNNTAINQVTVFDNYDMEKFTLVRDGNSNGIYDNFNGQHIYTDHYSVNIDYGSKPNVTHSTITYRLKLKPEYHNGQEYKTSVYKVNQAPRIEYNYNNVLNSLTFPQTTIIAPQNIASTISINGKVNWNINQSIYKPNSVKLALYKTVDGTKTLVEEQEISDNNIWRYTWNDLPTTENGSLIDYQVEEIFDGQYSDYWYSTVNIFSDNSGLKTYSFTNYLNDDIDSDININLSVNPSGQVLKNIKLKLIPKIENEIVEIPNLVTTKNITLDTDTKHIEWKNLPSLYNGKVVSYDVEVENLNDFPNWSVNKKKNGKLYSFDFVKSTIDLVVVNRKKTSKLIIDKVDERGKPLAGATFALTNKATNEQILQISDQNGKIIFENLKAGEYRLTEEIAPQGYNTIDEVWNIEVDENGNISIEGSGVSNNRLTQITNNELNKDIIANNFVIGNLKAILSEKGDDFNLKLIVDWKNFPPNTNASILFKENSGFTVKENFNEHDGSKFIPIFKIGNSDTKEYNITLTPNENIRYDTSNKILQSLKISVAPFGIEDFNDIIPNINISSKSHKSIKVVNEKFSFTLFKKNAEDIPLEGAEFTLKKINNDNTSEIIKTDIKSDKNGFIKVTGIEIGGKYELWETKAPEGYALPKKAVKIFTVNDYGEPDFSVETPSTNVYNFKISYNLSIKKRDADEVDNVVENTNDSNSYDIGKKLVATLELQKLNDNGVYEKIGNDIVTNKENGYAKIEDIKDGSYKIIEKAPPENYKLLEGSIQFTMYNGKISNISGYGRVFLNNGTDNEIVAIVKNKKIKTDIEIKKIDLNGNGIIGSTFEIYNADENLRIVQGSQPITQISPNTNGTLVNNGGPGYSSGTYVLKESTPPPGYQIPPNNGEIPFYIEENGNIIIPAKKTDNGYAKDDTSPYANLITIENDDKNYLYRYTVAGNNKVLDKITIKNVPKYNLHIKKRDADEVDHIGENINDSNSYDTEKKLVATLELQKKNDNGVYDKIGDDIVTDEQNGYALINDISDGSYQIKETKGPEGYILLKNPVKFTVKEGKLSEISGDGRVFLNNGTGLDIVAIVKNKKIKTDIKLYKTDMDNKNLSGAVFEIYNADEDGNATGNAIEEKTVENSPVIENSEGKDVFNSNGGGFSKGVYVLREKTSPSSYQKIPDIKFYVEESGKIIIPAKKDENGNWIEDTKSPMKKYVTVEHDKHPYQWSYDSTTHDSNKILEVVTIKNHKAEYPSTGGKGAEVFVLLGLSIMSYVVLIYKRKLQKDN